MQPLGRNGRQTAVRVAQYQQCIGLKGNHQLVTAVDDVPDGGPQIISHGIHIDFGIIQLEVFKENPVQVIVVILSGMRKNRIEIPPAFCDHRRQAYDLRAGADDDQELEFAVVAECYVGIIEFDGHFLCYQLSVIGYRPARMTEEDGLSVKRFGIIVKNVNFNVVKLLKNNVSHELI